MNLAIISDEISKDFKEAVGYGVDWGIEFYELRNLKSGRIPYITKEELNKILKIKESCGINISAISPGLFNISLKDEEQLKRELEEKIYDSFRFAEQIGTRDVIIASFKRYPRESPSDYVQIIHILGRMAALAEKYGFRLLLENEKNYWCDTGDNTAKLLEEINSRALRANWDPANAYVAGEIPYPYGFLAIRKYTTNLHVKDVSQVDPDTYEWVTIGDGEIDWAGQFKAILQGVDIDYITIETRCKPGIECSKKNIVQIRQIVQDCVVNDNYMIR